MSLSKSISTSERTLAFRRLLVVVITLAMAGGAALALASGAEAAAAPVQLGTAGSFAVLAGSGITNTGPTTITGDIGTFPTTTMTGMAQVTLHGANDGGNAITQGAKRDLVTAYDNAKNQRPHSTIAGDLGGLTLVPGVYFSGSSIGLTGRLTLNAQGNPAAVFIFQAGSTLTTASSSRVKLINGAQSCNVFWQVGSSATLGTYSVFRGTILALTSITVTTGVSIDGRVLARNGAVTLDSDTITSPTCAGSSTTSTSTTTTTTSSSTTTTSASSTTTTSASSPTTTTTLPPSGNARPPLGSVGFTG